MKKQFRTLTGILAIALSLSWATIAETRPEHQKSNQKAVKISAERTQSATNIQMAHDLADYGKKTQSAEALLTAAQILASYEQEKLDGKSGEPDPYEPGKLLELAATYAPQSLEKRIEEVKAGIGKSSKSNTSGRVQKLYTSVEPLATDVYEVEFRGNEDWYVLVSGDGSTDLDLFVYDENGRLIDSDEDDLDDCILQGTPAWTGKFTIKVKNLGPYRNHYVIGVD